MEQSFRYPTDMIDLATYAGKYRKALIDQSVPEELANQLVRDWHNQALGEWAGVRERPALRLADIERATR